MTQTKTLDKTPLHTNAFNVTGYGGGHQRIASKDMRKFMATVKRVGLDKACASWKISRITGWRVVKHMSQPTEEILRKNGDYDKDFRMRACMAAISSDMKTAAQLYGCSRASIGNWLKAYDLANTYFNREKQPARL